MSGESGERSKINSKRILANGIWTVGSMTVITLISLGFDWIGFSEATIVLMYLLGVLMVASRTAGYVYGISASLIGVLLFNYFFTAPRLSLSVHDPQYLVTFFVMLIVAIVTSTLTARVKQQAELSSVREKRTSMLYQISQSMLKTKGVQDIYPLIIGQLEGLFNFPACLYFPDDKRMLVRIPLREAKDGTLDSEEHEIAERVFRTGTASGPGLAMVTNNSGWFVPVIGQSRILGVIVIVCPPGSTINEEQVTLLEAVAAQVALAVEREKVLETEQSSKMEIERERLRNTLLRSISHDLRTPLTGIAGATSTILDNYDHLDDETKRKLLDGMGEDVQWLIRLVENLLSMTRLEAGIPVVKKHLEAVEEVVAEAVAQVRKRAGDHRISVKMPKDLILIPMDGNLIEQVLVNLMDNAIKYTPAGAEIRLEVELSGHHIWFEVLDNGYGISDVDMPHLFDLFYTGANVRSETRRGSGLGLAICQSIVRAHNGEIVAGNRPDGGAIFQFSIPVSIPEEAAHE